MWSSGVISLHMDYFIVFFSPPVGGDFSPSWGEVEKEAPLSPYACYPDLF